MGNLVLETNATKIQPLAPAVITPTSYTATAQTVTYAVTVKATGPWVVSIPKDASWVTATLANTSGAPATPTLVDGNGNGTVTITLARNGTTAKTHKNRSTTITIAGRSHTIKQTWK